MADVSSRSSRSPERGARLGRTGLIVFGGATVAVGIVLLFNPVAAARTLAFLIGLALVLAGCLEIAGSQASGRRWGPVLVGAILIVGGLVAAFWPGITLWTLAVITGVSLLLHGVVRIALAVAARREVPTWGWLAFAGVLNVVVGIMALAWPQVTVLVLSVLLGIQVLLFGGFLLAAGLSMPRAR
ncbi:HdeD family acid-resistance protein [Geodermatophilus ruber]|uniref:Uncharacterized membrane protein HdeD, DUF308 family n=1 Tax=Geodermatophilus ruber TaxID=504800 RepID=A0A1I4FAM0_9ACTN|nr:DUF308 domain-containing protein [Geodermatophilus ruber]SFL14924.1 Uncharacterized membrane protein HdeD, DUF308 family [Geodermatophilus ruber]